MQKPRYVLLRWLFLLETFVIAPVFFGVIHYSTGDFWLAAATAVMLAFFGLAGFIYFSKLDSRGNGTIPSDVHSMTSHSE